MILPGKTIGTCQVGRGRALICYGDRVSFHSDFWVAIAAAAPVIALSSTVVLSDNFKMGVRATITSYGSSRLWRHIQKLGIRAGMTGLINTLLQSIMLYCSLESLLTEKNYIEPQIALLAEFLGLLLVLVATSIHGLMLANMTRYGEAKSKEINKETPTENEEVSE
jgi:hypothetical protein